jgi:PAS domain S-box-containing protein
MTSFLSGIFDASFMPHGHCYQWRPEILWLHALSDSFIALAYFAIPFLLIVFVSKRKDLEFSWMFVMFSAFIWLCGMTHVMNIFTIWNGTYLLSGGVKLVTGVVSMLTAVALVPLLPRALALPSPSQLRTVNDELSREIEARRSAEEKLRQLNAELERRVAERGAELEASNAQLREEVAERSRTEVALRESEARFRQLANSMPQLVWSADSDGRVNYYNERRHELEGIEPGDDGAWSWHPVLHPDDVQATDAEWKRAVDSGTRYEIEHRARMRDGSFRWHLSRGVPVRDNEGNVTQWYGSATDIHVQKEIERTLREREVQLRELSESLERRVAERTEDLILANQMLESRNLELQEFAYVASHDLKEPLRKIRTFAGMMLDEHGASLPEDARMYLDRMQYASDRMMSLINDLLTLSRASAQQMSLEDVDLSTVVSEVWADLPVETEWSMEANLGDLPVIEADAVRIRQLVQNVLSNAIKYRTEDQPVRIEVEGRVLNPSTSQSAVELTISDNGIGFDQRFADRIFGAFQRLHGRNEYEGTGMGLAICRRIVDRHHGSISALGRPGEGATFRIVLPIRQPRRES